MLALYVPNLKFCLYLPCFLTDSWHVYMYLSMFLCMYTKSQNKLYTEHNWNLWHHNLCHYNSNWYYYLSITYAAKIQMKLTLISRRYRLTYDTKGRGVKHEHSEIECKKFTLRTLFIQYFYSVSNGYISTLYRPQSHQYCVWPPMELIQAVMRCRIEET
jgi:hypothetical protein